MPVMLLKMPLMHAYQTIRLKLANLCFIREFVSKYHVDCDLDYEVDGCSYYATEEEFKQAIGWWHYVPRALVRPFGVHIMEGSSEMREQINLKPRDNAADGSGPRNAWGCIRLKKDYDTICAARFVLLSIRRSRWEPMCSPTRGSRQSNHCLFLAVDTVGRIVAAVTQG